MASFGVRSDKQESQDICFIKDDYRDFLALRGVPEREGNFYYQGNWAGKHRGIPYYSFGQRRGLGVALGERVFVREFDTSRNRIMLGEKPVSKRFSVREMNIFTHRFQSGRYSVQTRYQSRISDAFAEIKGNSAEVAMAEAQEIVTPGQFAVFYRDDFVAHDFGVGGIGEIADGLECAAGTIFLPVLRRDVKADPGDSAIGHAKRDGALILKRKAEPIPKPLLFQLHFPSVERSLLTPRS